LDDDADTFSRLRSHDLSEAFAAVVPDGYMCGDGHRLQCAVLTSERELIGDVSTRTGLPTESPEGHWILRRPEWPEPMFIPEPTGVLAIKPVWDKHYFHWMVQVLPRLHLLKASGFAIDRYLLSPLRHSYQHETLAMLDIDEASIIEVDGQFCVQARELVIPSVPPWVMPTWVGSFLRGNLLKEPPPAARERLYIPRDPPAARHVRNEDEVLGVLADFGFRPFYPERVSVREQAETFASAEAIAGPHGGGLTNLVFSRPGTKVFEFFPPSFVFPLFWMVSEQCGLDYNYLVGRGDRPDSWAGWAHPAGNLDAMELDPQGVAALLRRAGL
jgi:hypothetical protein